METVTLAKCEIRSLGKDDLINFGENRRILEKNFTVEGNRRTTTDETQSKQRQV